jgi:subtilase family serine protease
MEELLSMRPLFALITALFFFAPPGDSAQDRIRGPVESGRAVVLRGNFRTAARRGIDRGALEAATKIDSVKLVLDPSGPQAAALEQFLEEQRNPSSPSYQNWLTPEEYGERFGVTQNDLARLTSWLESRGFAIEHVARARNWITFSGTAGQIASAFQTELHDYALDGEKHFANAKEPSIPSSLSGVVTSIRGLDDFRPRPHRADIRLHPDFNAAGGYHYLGPDDLATIYNIAPLYQAGVDGTGQKLAIAGQTAIDIADLRAFRSRFNLPVRDPQLVLAGPDPGISQADQIEANLDLEWAGAVARNATVVYVYSRNVFESLQYAIDQNLAPVISLSYGSCEIGSPATYRTVAQQANAQGITWINSSGDSGAAGCDYGVQIATQGLAATFPANIPEVTAVGGTEFNEGSGSYWSKQSNAGLGSALAYIPERAWNDTPLGFGLASGGGGASVLFVKPWWQTGPGVPNDLARDVPDISLAASGAHDAYILYARGALRAVGGTSAAAPAFAGIVTLLNQYLVAKGVVARPGLGNMNPRLYNLAQNTPGVFHDITAGDNIVPCAAGTKGCADGALGYAAGPGYDLATGLGSIDAWNLVTKWTSLPSAVGTTMTLAASPANISAHGTTQLTATITAVTGAGTPGGSVAFFSGAIPLGSAGLTGSGASAMAMLTVRGSSLDSGADTITALYTATASFSNSTAIATVNVSAPQVQTSTMVTAVPTTLAQSESTLVTATVIQAEGSSAPVGSVSFFAGNTLLGTMTLASSAATLMVNAASLRIGLNTITVNYTATENFTNSSGSVNVTVVLPETLSRSRPERARPAPRPSRPIAGRRQ